MRCFFVLRWTVVLLLLCGGATAQQPTAGGSTNRSGFRAAVVKVDITPATPQRLHGYGERVSTGVHDPLYHRIVVLDDGSSQFVLVSSDVCILSTVQYDRISELLERRYGINPLSFWWSLLPTIRSTVRYWAGRVCLFTPSAEKDLTEAVVKYLLEHK
ncbi:MAG: hypothetical protein RBS80_18535 [Thermoguttaceae bacterium]|nr:hypothetical protein [Thermoguttaceae bacterium]